MPDWDVCVAQISVEKVTQQLHPTNKVYKIKLVESRTGLQIP
jgi:hypothetical protein